MEKIKPKPPEPIGVKQPSLSLPEKNYDRFIMAFNFSNWKSKTILRSRTILTVVLTILGFIGAKFFGLDIDLGSVVDSADGLQLGELLLAIGLVVAGFFRKYVKADLSKPSGG
jgi:hypothetical protein